MRRGNKKIFKIDTQGKITVYANLLNPITNKPTEF